MMTFLPLFQVNKIHKITRNVIILFQNKSEIKQNIDDFVAFLKNAQGVR